MDQVFRDAVYGRFLDPERCEVRQVAGPHQCPEVAAWSLEDEKQKRSLVCDRCFHEWISRLTTNGRRVMVSQLPQRSKRYARVVSPSAEGG